MVCGLSPGGTWIRTIGPSCKKRVVLVETRRLLKGADDRDPSKLQPFSRGTGSSNPSPSTGESVSSPSSRAVGERPALLRQSSGRPWGQIRKHGWAATPSGTRGVLNDALSIYFSDATLAGHTVCGKASIRSTPAGPVCRRLSAGGNRIRTIGPAPAKGSSGRCQSETAARRKAEPLTGSGPKRQCLPGVLPTAFPFAEGPRVRIRLPPAESLRSIGPSAAASHRSTAEEAAPIASMILVRVPRLLGCREPRNRLR
jgi:hypothetical protein